jgi:hypothetical protein
MPLFAALLLVFLSLVPAHAQNPGTAPIQDNSFLIEEAYNQEYGVIQHISSFARFWNSKDWIYTFTQEWPAPLDARHQLSYTLAFQHAGGLPGSGSGIGDLVLNYRYQLVGNGESRFAFSPHLSMIVATGDPLFGRGFGGTGVQTNLPISLVLFPKLVSHWNVGATWVPHASNTAGQHGYMTGYNLGHP